MILLDVNIYIHAFRADASGHERCKEFIEEHYAQESPVGYSQQALSGMLRIVTHSKVFKKPSKIEEALDFCKTIRSHPLSIIVNPGETHWDIFEELCIQSNAKGNLIPDAYFAALAIEAGCEWITLDHDFARFPKLKWRMP